MAVKIVWNKPGLDSVLQNPEGVVGRYLKKKGRLITAAARRQVGVRTGALRNSIHMRHFRDPRGQYIKVGSSLSYARAHHDGTKPHLILPTKGKNLRFFSKGFLVFAQMVRHPGTKPNRYLTDNLKLIK